MDLAELTVPLSYKKIPKMHFQFVRAVWMLIDGGLNNLQVMPETSVNTSPPRDANLTYAFLEFSNLMLSQQHQSYLTRIFDMRSTLQV